MNFGTPPKAGTRQIPFDLASPGPRAWDLGQSAYRFVPLTDPDNPDELRYFEPAKNVHTVEIAGREYPAICSLRPLYDPGMTRIRA